MKHFEITLACRAFRIVRNIIAASSVRATQIALDMIPPDASRARMVLICKVKKI